MFSKVFCGPLIIYEAMTLDMCVLSTKYLIGISEENYQENYHRFGTTKSGLALLEMIIDKLP